MNQFPPMPTPYVVPKKKACKKKYRTYNCPRGRILGADTRGYPCCHDPKNKGLNLREIKRRVMSIPDPVLRGKMLDYWRRMGYFKYLSKHERDLVRKWKQGKVRESISEENFPYKRKKEKWNWRRKDAPSEVIARQIFKDGGTIPQPPPAMTFMESTVAPSLGQSVVASSIPTISVFTEQDKFDEADDNETLRYFHQVINEEKAYEKDGDGIMLQERDIMQKIPGKPLEREIMSAQIPIQRGMPLKDLAQINVKKDPIGEVEMKPEKRKKRRKRRSKRRKKKEKADAIKIQKQIMRNLSAINEEESLAAGVFGVNYI